MRPASLMAGAVASAWSPSEQSRPGGAVEAEAPQVTPWFRNAGPQAQFDAPIELCAGASSRPAGLASGRRR